MKKIFNQIIKNGVIPNSFKNALVTPLYKGNGHKADLKSYRPIISLLNVFSKVFEKAIKNRLINYLKENNLLAATHTVLKKV